MADQKHENGLKMQFTPEPDKVHARKENGALHMPFKLLDLQQLSPARECIHPRQREWSVSSVSPLIGLSVPMCAPLWILTWARPLSQLFGAKLPCAPQLAAWLPATHSLSATWHVALERKRGSKCSPHLRQQRKKEKRKRNEKKQGRSGEAGSEKQGAKPSSRKRRENQEKKKKNIYIYI